MSRGTLSLAQVGSRWFSLALLAATVLMVLAVLAGATGTADAGSPSEQRKFKSQFQGKFNGTALATDVEVPAGAGFGETIFVAHKCDFSFLTVGNSASAGVQALAEGGSTSDFQAEVTAAVAAGNAQASWTIDAPDLPTGSKNGPSSVPVKDEFSCLTVLFKINPTSDWFAGVSAHDLRAGGTWPTPRGDGSIFVDLFPFDAGTLGGEEFATSSTATNPQGTIASLSNSGKFSNNRIARLKLTLKNPALTKGVEAEEAIESIIVTWSEVVAACGYHVMWKSGRGGLRHRWLARSPRCRLGRQDHDSYDHRTDRTGRIRCPGHRLQRSLPVQPTSNVRERGLRNTVGRRQHGPGRQFHAVVARD